MKRFKKLCAQGYLWLILLILYLPIFVVVAFSFNESKLSVTWTGFTLQWYERALANRNMMEALVNSLVVSLWSCLMAALVGTVAAVGLARANFRTKGMLEGVSSIPIMIPEIVLGLAFLVTFSFAGLEFGMVTLVLAHTTFCIPYVLIIVRSRLVGLDKSYEEAARDLGASPLYAFLTIIVPLVMPAVASGVLLAFAMSLDDVVISFFVNGPGATTLPVYIFGKLKTQVTPEINAMCSMMLAVTFIVVALSQLLRARAAKK